MSYSSAVDAVYTAIDQTVFDFALVPDDYRGQYADSSEFVSVKILTPSGARVAFGNSGQVRETSGLLSFSIFTPMGKGPGRIKEIIDQLDVVFSMKRVGDLDFGPSSVVSIGQDSANENLSHTEYRLQFTTFGEM